MSTVDAEVLEAKVKQMYRLVVEQPHGMYHFAMGRPLAERLSYDPGMLDQVPIEAVESFAGVGYVFGLAQLVDGKRVLDLGSGSGMDACYAAQLVGSRGRVIGIDFTPQQVARARRLAAAAGLDQVEFHEGGPRDAETQSPSSGSVQEAQSWQPSLIAPRLPQSRRPCGPVRR
jgi:arsenite methyltransferase